MTHKLRTSDRLLFVLVFFGDILEDDPNPLGLFSSSYKSLFTFASASSKVNNFRQALYRNIHLGYIEKRKVGSQRYLRLTSHGRNKIIATYPNLRYRNRVVWDGYWRFVSFDVSESYRKVRGLLRNTLKSFGYVGFQQSLYISPFRNDVELHSYLLDTSLAKFVRIFLAKSFENDKALAQDLWRIRDIGDLYNKALIEYRRTRNLSVFRNTFLDIASIDPFLPLEILPDAWPGCIAEKIVQTAKQN